ncbi:MAG TPA: sn-glycerol-3-phosphate ABC transporter ATP-binding protein UgpC, partial [Vicinamibacterales bacterium]|nr:sn-glycerol-3-phosphate ABC transporter ATP-binding protein UgpC [Vicinamibacterales bacterium]
MARVEFSEVTKEFADGVRAVENLTLRIDDGEFVVFVGPSGCGKTTALRMTAGLEAISEGTISIGDRVVNDVPSAKRDIAMVFQNYALYPHMSVFENMAFGLQQQRLPKREVERRVREIANLLELDPYLSRKPRALSGGQRQRVAMGRAIVREPAVFLMDEPLSNLDAKLRVQMRAEIRALQHEIGTTTIYVTHDQVEAMTMGDRVAVLRNGVLQQVATPHALYHHPTNVFVAEFIGSPAMNLFEVPVDHGRELVLDSSERLTAPAWAVDQLAGLSRVVVGIRPEDLHIDGGGSGLQASVRAVEDLGAEVIAHLETESAVATTRHVRELADELADPRLESGFRRAARAVTTNGERVRIVARLAATVRVREGERLRMTFDADKIHLFDADSGLALKRP